MKIDARAGIGGVSVGTSSRSNRSSSSVSSSTLSRSSPARSETTRRHLHHDPRRPEKSGTMVEHNSRLGSNIAEVMSMVKEDDATVDSCNSSCQNEDIGVHITVAENDHSHRHAYDAGGQVVHDTAAQRLLLEYEATKEEMTQPRNIDQQLMMDSMNKSDDVRRFQLQRDADFQKLEKKTDAELLYLQVTKTDELRRADEE
jgi:hypothetical protein